LIVRILLTTSQLGGIIAGIGATAANRGRTTEQQQGAGGNQGVQCVSAMLEVHRGSLCRVAGVVCNYNTDTATCNFCYTQLMAYAAQGYNEVREWNDENA